MSFMDKRKNKLLRVLALLLMLAAAFAVAIPAVAGGNKYDFSNKDADGTAVIDAVTLIEEHIGERLSDAERAFLDSYSTLTLKYNSVINANNVSLAYDDDGGILTVSAREYVYGAPNGSDLVWIPKTVKADGAELPLVKADGVYVAEFEADGLVDVSVTYVAEASISKDDFNRVLNLYHETAKYACDIADYEAKRAAYETYLYEKRLYDDKKAAYDAYLKDYADYEKQLYAYENYEKLKAQYEKDLDAYNAYLMRLEDLAADIEKYEQYEAKLARIEKQLSAFELVYVVMKNDRDVYGAVMGGAVTQVLGSVGDIIAELGGKYETLVETAERATISLRGIMPEYKKCETPEEKYGFYTANYTKMCESMLELTWALDLLYYAPGVKAMLKAFEKHESYVILVAQLVLISNALIDGNVSAGEGDTFVKYDLDWTIDKRNFNTVLNNVVYFVDDDSSKPFDGGYPIKVEKPDITAVEKPVYPKRPASRPVAPDTVNAPGTPPAEITNPVYPTVTESAVRDVYLTLDQAEKKDLVDSNLAGEIDLRDPSKSDKSLTLETIVCKSRDSKAILIRFNVGYDGTGVTPFTHEITTDANSAVLYDGKVPDGYSNVVGTYEFAGWKVEGTAQKVDLTKGFEKSTVLVPFYERKPTYYNVTWIVEGKEYVESYAAGSIPTPSFTPTKESQGDFRYKFVGWMYGGRLTNVERLYSNVTYEAKFTPQYLIPSGVGGGAAVSKNDTALICNVSDFTNPIFDLSAILPEIAGERSLSIVSDGSNPKIPRFSLHFSFTDVVTMRDLNIVSMILRCSFNADSASFEILLYDKNNSKITDIDIRPELSVGHKYADVSSFVLVLDGQYVNHRIDSSDVSFKIKPSVKHFLKREYYVTVVNNALCDVSADKAFGYAGDKVTLNVLPKVGIDIVGIDVLDEMGNPVSGFDGKSFTLPSRDVIISVRAKYILYNVEFVSDGAVISRQELTYGQMPTVPPDPLLASDGSFTYTFAGWSPAVESVSGNITYEAVFDKAPVIPNDTEAPDNPINNIMKYVKIALIAVCSVLVGIIVLIIVIIIRKRKKSGASVKEQGEVSDAENSSKEDKQSTDAE